MAPSRYPSASQNVTKPQDRNLSLTTGNLPPTNSTFPSTSGNSSPTTGKFPSTIGNVSSTSSNSRTTTGNYSTTMGKFPSMADNLSATSRNFPSATGNVSPMTPNSALNQNQTYSESEHRYEEIGESLTSLQLGKSGTNAPQRTSTIIDEFDPYSSVPPAMSQLYDNVPDNYNTVYSEHRYEDIPDQITYDQVPCDSQPQTVSEVCSVSYKFCVGSNA